MTVDLAKQIEALKTEWMIGGGGIDRAPHAWKAALPDDRFPESGLIAIAGQALQFALQPEADTRVKYAPRLPRLALPTPPSEARALIRLLRASKMIDEVHVGRLIQLLTARGYAIHPIDCLPKAFASLPDIYAPWELWLRDESRANASETSRELQSENWDEWWPADRRAALSILRQQQPEVARALIAEKAPSLPAEERLRVLEVLADGLCVDDRALLDAFAEDRSSKVRLWVHQCLGRIGFPRDESSDIQEYVDFLSISKSILQRKVKVTANRLKTDPQRRRRAELAAKLSLHSVVRGLQLGTEAELITAWEHVDPQASDEWVRMVIATGSEQAVAMLASRISTFDGISAETIHGLFDRLGRTSRLELLPRILANDDACFTSTLTCCKGMFGEIPWTLLEPSRGLKALLQMTKEASTSKPAVLATLREGLFALGLIADRSAAAKLMEVFSRDHLFSSDPLLGIFKLNMCLPPGESL